MANDSPKQARTARTKIVIISDTHTRSPLPPDDTKHAYRQPLPSGDILLHAGDITMDGRIQEYQKMFEMLGQADAPLKIVIAGNHDVSLDAEFYTKNWHRSHGEKYRQDVDEVRELWTGKEAQAAGIVYLQEGTRTFTLTNGATFTIYTSPYQPAFCGWAFAYERNQDRFSSPSPHSVSIEASNPVPSWPEIDIMLTHGPPYGIRDTTANAWLSGNKVGCANLKNAVRRCRPRIHAFGHIHEGWGAVRKDWGDRPEELVGTDPGKILADRGACVDLSEEGGKPLEFGKETLFVNASIMDVHYRPKNAPWVVYLDLPLAEDFQMETERKTPDELVN